jgi:hypothetical protein
MAKRSKSLIAGQLVVGCLMVVAIVFVTLNCRQLGSYLFPACLLPAVVLALLVRSFFRLTFLDTAVICATIFVLEMLLIPAVSTTHSGRHARTAIQSADNP